MTKIIDHPFACLLACDHITMKRVKGVFHEAPSTLGVEHKNQRTLDTLLPELGE